MKTTVISANENAHIMLVKVNVPSMLPRPYGYGAEVEITGSKNCKLDADFDPHTRKLRLHVRGKEDVEALRKTLLYVGKALGELY